MLTFKTVHTVFNSHNFCHNVQSGTALQSKWCRIIH